MPIFPKVLAIHHCIVFLIRMWTGESRTHWTSMSTQSQGLCLLPQRSSLSLPIALYMVLASKRQTLVGLRTLIIQHLSQPLKICESAAHSNRLFFFQVSKKEELYPSPNFSLETIYIYTYIPNVAYEGVLLHSPTHPPTLTYPTSTSLFPVTSSLCRIGCILSH